MKNSIASYKNQLLHASGVHNNLNIFNNDTLSRQFHTVSAGLLNYLPHIAYEKHESIFRNILLHRRLSIIDQNTKEVLGNVTVKNFAPATVNWLKENPVIICTFHLGSYRLINMLLAENEIPFSLVVAKSILTSNGETFNELHNLHNNKTKPSIFNLIDAEAPAAALQMYRDLKRGNTIVIYVDGNTGAGIKTNQNENSCNISFQNQQIKVRTGVGYLSHTANVPVLPVISYRDSIDKIVLHFGEPVFPEININRNVYAEKLMQQLYDLASPFLCKYHYQWEGWLYLHKVANIINPLSVFEQQYSPQMEGKKLIFNSVFFGLFKISHQKYLLNKTNYMTYSINDDLYSLFQTLIKEPVCKTNIDENLFSEFIKKGVLIAV